MNGAGWQRHLRTSSLLILFRRSYCVKALTCARVLGDKAQRPDHVIAHIGGRRLAWGTRVAEVKAVSLAIAGAAQCMTPSLAPALVAGTPPNSAAPRMLEVGIESESAPPSVKATTSRIHIRRFSNAFNSLLQKAASSDDCITPSHGAACGVRAKVRRPQALRRQGRLRPVYRRD